jgi:hypothetical protein
MGGLARQAALGTADAKITEKSICCVMFCVKDVQAECLCRRVIWRVKFGGVDVVLLER